ncbi:AAA family ATPase [Limnoglobus roseus]|uniref:ATP-binding protein n=1 Tax=Limnoglobus roseus TaxID=2598579 RepID=A0A5C1ADR4_9BACT|nr:MoxR family ATPase [Limnoglobus roseus]QEL16850.1 ATP-binding protein [Limnoglobus roseus]
MRPRDVSNALCALLPTRRPVYLWGPPGVGKSAVVRHAADALKLKLVDVRATLLDPVDLRGLPKVTKDRAEWCPPAFLPRAGDGVLFLDELAQAPPLVQAACLQLVLDRRVGEYELPPGWAVVAASNRQEDRAGTHRLITPLLNRFVHLDLDVSPEDWQAWAVVNGVAPEVRAFLQYRPALLSQFDPAASPRAFPTPRSWAFVSDVLAGTPADLLHRVVAGCVGDGPAAEFVGFLQLYRELPDLDAIGRQPETTAVPREPAVLYALVGAIAEKCKADAAPVHGLVQYALRLPDEFALLALRDVLAVKPKLASLSIVQQWIAQARTKGLFLAA